MGLFSSLVKSILTSNGASASACAPAAEGAPRSAAMSAQDGRHPAARAIDIDGDCEKTVFAYVGVPFKGIRKGAEFYVEPLGHDMVLHSKSTGTTADSAEFGDTPLSYNGTAFGFTYSGLGFLKEMVAAGFTFRLKVKKTGMYSPGVPELVSLTAEPRLLEQWWERQKTLTTPVPFSEEDELIRLEAKREAQYRAKVAQVRRRRTGIELAKDSLEVWITVTDRNWIGGKLPRKDLRFTPSFEIVPTPKGSSAKPHIRVLADGNPLVEINAMSTEAYRQISANRERPCRAIYMWDYYQDGTDQTKLYLVFD